MNDHVLTEWKKNKNNSDRGLLLKLVPSVDQTQTTPSEQS